MNNLLFEYSSLTKNASRRIRPGYKVFINSLIIFFIIFAFSQTSFVLNPYGYSKFTYNLQKLFSFINQDPSFPSHTVLENSLNYLWITIKITTTGTVIGFFLALITAFLSAGNITNVFFARTIKVFLLFLRSFPAIVFITAAQDGFNKEIAGIVILAWFSWIWCNKYLVEIIMNIDTEGYEHFINKGYGRFYAFRKQIVLRCKNKFIMVFLYSLEANLRWTTMLATVGVIGIGFFINGNVPNHFEFIGIPIVILLICILFIEILSVFINKILLEVKSKNHETFNWKKIIKYFLVSFLFFITIYTFWTIKIKGIDYNIFKEKIQTFLSPDFSIWWSPKLRINPWLEILQLIYQCVVAVFITMCYGFTMSLFLSEQIQKSYVWFIFKIINSVLKIIPVVILFYIFNPIFLNPIGLGIILFGIHSGTTLAKLLSESINTLNMETVEHYDKQGYSKLMIIKTYIWPIIKKDFKSFAYIRFELIFRNMIFLGFLGFSIIGNNIFQRRSDTSTVAAYIWPIVITIFIYNIIPPIIKYIKGTLCKKQ